MPCYAAVACLLQPDELTLREGDVLNITTKTDGGFYKGTIIRVLVQTSRQTTGWFPRQHVKEIIGLHHKAKVLKANYMKQTSVQDYKS